MEVQAKHFAHWASSLDQEEKTHHLKSRAATLNLQYTPSFLGCLWEFPWRWACMKPMQEPFHEEQKTPVCWIFYLEQRHKEQYASSQEHSFHWSIHVWLQQGGVENVQYATTIKERGGGGEEAHVRSAVQGLPHTSNPVSSSRSSCRASTSLSFSIWFDVFTTS